MCFPPLVLPPPPADPLSHLGAWKLPPGSGNFGSSLATLRDGVGAGMWVGVRVRNSLLTSLRQSPRTQPSLLSVIRTCHHIVSAVKATGVFQRNTASGWHVESSAALDQPPVSYFFFSPVLWQQFPAFFLGAGRGEGGSGKRSACPLGEACQISLLSLVKGVRELTGNT